jgi:hypothetical protein
MDLNHDNQTGARTDLIRDQALTATCHVDVALSSFDSGPDGLCCEIEASLSPPLVFSARMAQRSLCQRDLPSHPIGRAPKNGAKAPVLVMDPALSIDSHDLRLRRG